MILTAGILICVGLLLSLLLNSHRPFCLFTGVILLGLASQIVTIVAVGFAIGGVIFLAGGMVRL